MRTLVPALCLTLFLNTAAEAGEAKAELVEARKIWDAAPHNAFTDLARFKDRWYCAFREGEGHVSPDGALRVITSSDGEKWESAALITSKSADLRDPKIAVTPDGRLMVTAAAALHQPKGFTHQSVIYYSKDGRNWGEGIDVGDPNYWLWRVSHDRAGKYAYGVGYECGKVQDIRLYRSGDGRTFEQWVVPLYSAGYPNESSIVFQPDDTALCLLRRDAGTGLLGVSSPPYKSWEWKDLGVRLGGPHMIRLQDGRLLAAVRLYSPKVRTGVCLVDPDKGKLEEILTLPSGGDTSYPGLVWHDGLLWVSYYSSHEGKTNIYLAKVKPPAKPE